MGWTATQLEELANRDRKKVRTYNDDPNIPLFRKAVEWVEEQEKKTEDREWEQSAWVSAPWLYFQEGEMDDIKWCETAFCVAGKIAFDLGWNVEWSTLYDGAHERPDHVMSKVITTPSGEKETVYAMASDIAESALGGRYDSGSRDLFGGSNTATDIRSIAEAICGEKL